MFLELQSVSLWNKERLVGTERSWNGPLWLNRLRWFCWCQSIWNIKQNRRKCRYVSVTWFYFSILFYLSFYLVNFSFKRNRFYCHLKFHMSCLEVKLKTAKHFISSFFRQYMDTVTINNDSLVDCYWAGYHDRFTCFLSFTYSI